MENQRLADFTALNDTQIYQFSPRYFPLNYFATKIRFSYLGDWGMIEIQKKHTSPWKKGWGKKGKDGKSCLVTVGDKIGNIK